MDAKGIAGQTFSIACQGILFDMDGVLIDSRSCVERLWIEWARDHAIAEEDVLRAAHGRKTADTIRLAAPSLDAEAEAKRFDDRELTETRGVTAMTGAAPLLKSISLSRWGIVTSANRALAPKRLERLGLPIPTVLVTCDDVLRGKPDAEGYLRGARHLGFHPTQCVVIEDAPAGIRAAREAGCKTIGVLTTHRRTELSEAAHVLPHLSHLSAVETTDSVILKGSA